jgi:tRNA(Ile)-lysidine synthase
MTMPADLQDRVRAFLQPRLFPGARVCVGYSGGIDSTVLLHILAGLREEMGFALSALHVHHGLSAHADAWAEACASACRGWGVPLNLRHVTVTVTGQGLEAAARAARYAAYAEEAADFIVLAHHRDDQVETFFLRLLRGAGVEGLAAMPAARRLGKGPAQLLRPLLQCERAALRAYAGRHGLNYCEDDSNQDLGRTRNFLRQAWLPQLESRFPAYRRSVARAAGHLEEAGGLLADLAALDAERVIGPAGVDGARLAQLGPARARNLLRHWLAGQGLAPPGAAQLDELVRQGLTARADAAPALALDGRVLRRHRGRLSVVPRKATASPGEWSWQGETLLDLGPAAGRLRFTPVVGAGLAAARLQAGAVRVRLRAGGERIRPDCRRPRRPLKKLLQEAAVPPWERARLPVLWIGGEVAWVAGVGVDCASQAAIGEPGWLIDWQGPED